VAQHLTRIRTGLYAARSYADRHGLPEGEADLPRHRFVGSDHADSRAPFLRWLRERVPEGAITYRTTEPAAMEAAIIGGAGLGFLGAAQAAQHPDLIEVLPPRPEWDAPLWIVTHVDLHRTRKVQAFLAALKDAAKGWQV
jgi:DNA-binding transcriptional LysR family regulator